MEKAEAKKLADFEKLKRSMKDKKKSKKTAHKKLVAKSIACSYLDGHKENALKRLVNKGFYTNSFKTDVLDNHVVPWLHDKAFEFLMDLNVQEGMPGLMLNELASEEHTEHKSRVEYEANRKEEVKAEEARKAA